MLNVSCSHSAPLKRKVAVSFASGVSMDVKLRSRLSRRSRINERDPSFPSQPTFTRVFFKSRSSFGTKRQASTNTRVTVPQGGIEQRSLTATPKAATQVQRGTDGEDKGALTGSPLCHRRWHFSRPRSRSSVCSKRLPPEHKKKKSTS